jgi:predicted membrane-bound mannosyltransferase/DNA-binding beta-propeller fold protein YncE
MSHDETTHGYFSWLLEQGRGYSHDPLSHGPLQFFAPATSYFLFGDSDASARYPAAVDGVLLVLLVWAFRRWIGNLSTVVTAALLFASPFIMYYTRYAREDPYVLVEAMLMFWAVFSYLESRRSTALYALSAALALHFCTKETSFIYAGALMVFLAALFMWEVLHKTWESAGRRIVFLVGCGAAAVGGGTALLVFLRDRTAAGESATLIVSPLVGMGVVLAIAGLILAGVGLVLDFGRRVRTEFTALDLLIVTATLTLPHLASLPAAALGWDPLAYGNPSEWGRTLALVVALIVISAGIGLLWNWRRWLVVAGIFAAIYIPLFTSLFTNPQGLATGLVGSLGYWLVQQGVQRAGQPLYYYALIQIPFYEYLVAIGCLVAAGVGIASIIRGPRTVRTPEERAALIYNVPWLYPLFFGYWSVAMLVLFTYAGERMPWLTVHIALPMVMLSGWVFGRFLGKVEWARFREGRTWALLGLIGLSLLATVRFFGSLLGAPPPFSGMELENLRATTGTLAELLVALGAGFGAYRLMTGWTGRGLARLAGVVALGLVYLLTLRTGLRASFINYNDATEFLVYAHSAGGPKLALSQIEELSRRLTGGLDVGISYDNESTYPFWWYLRNYPNAHYFAEAPSREILNDPLVLAGVGNYPKVEAILRDRYYAFEYNRVWWPMQDYFGLTGERLRNALASPEMRQALWEIWFDRDYTRYAEVTQRDFSLRNWNPSEKLKLYVRKDVASQVWDYGIAPAVLEPISLVDPYAEKTVVLPADAVLGEAGTAEGQLTLPRSIAHAPDGTLYVADTGNHRVQHLSADGTVLNTWGSFASLDQGEAPGGTFNEPWGIAVAPDGTVYVADTWNHRIQHFSADGRFIGMWGTFGQAETQSAFWGPRDVAVDSTGRVYVADTGNKRIAVFDKAGNPLGEIGEPGGGPLEGQLDEPVGIALGADGLVYIADTWNSRVQIFSEGDPNVWQALRSWSLDAWLTNSLENKPYLDISQNGDVCASDPDGFRMLCFDATGAFLAGWGTPGSDLTQFGLPVGVAFDSACGLWVADTGNNRLMHFTLPECQ